LGTAFPSFTAAPQQDCHVKQRSNIPTRKFNLALVFPACLIAAATMMPSVASVPHVCDSVVDGGGHRIDYERFVARLPTLYRDAFPVEPDSVRFDVLEQHPQQLLLNAFHLRGTSIGFAAGLDARVQIDPGTGLRQFSMTRIDEDCLAAAKARQRQPESVCAKVVANEIQRGAYALSFENSFLNHQLKFTLLRSRENPERWAMVASQRRGEPQTLQVEITAGGDGTSRVSWLIAHEGRSETFTRTLTSTLSSASVREAQFSPFEFGLLSSLSFFDELSDAHRGWVLYQEQVDTFEQPPAIGDDGIYGCHDAGRICGAEYDTCIPNGDTWLGCNLEPEDPTWGGGHDDDGDIIVPRDPNSPTDPNPIPDPVPDPGNDGDPAGCDNDGLPDWVVGSDRSNPQFEVPTVRDTVLADPNGLAPAPYEPPPHHSLAKFFIRYQITSLLQSGPAHPETEPDLTGTPPIAHVVQLIVRSTGGQFWCDLGLRYQMRPVTSTLPAGDAVTYREDGDEASCILDYAPGNFYRLHYELDPNLRWFEGAGESGNSGVFRGTIVPRRY
jgi:hypothetical protein